MSPDFNFLREIVLPSIVGGGTAFAALKYLSKSFLQHRLKKDIEAFKTELQEKTEFLKTNLSIYANEQSISFQRVDKQRANAIHEIYQNICDSSFALTQLTVGPDKKDSIDKQILFYSTKALDLYDRNTKMNETLRKFAIYFDNETYVMINDYFTTITNINRDFLNSVSNVKFGQISPEKLEQEREKISQVLNEKLLPIHQKTIDNFRYVLGVEKSKVFTEK